MPSGLGQRFDRPVSYAVSISNGTVKAGPGILYGWITTTTGDLEPTDGATPIGRVQTTAATVVTFPNGIVMGTNISFSASACVATIFYV